MNPVLNREVRRTGGRVLITLGDQDIDLSPSFTIFMSTRDPTVSHLETNVTSFFTITHAPWCEKQIMKYYQRRGEMLLFRALARNMAPMTNIECSTPPPPPEILKMATNTGVECFCLWQWRP